MSDLRSQLAAAFGRDPVAAPEPAAAAPPADPLLGPDAHLGTQWLAQLQELRRGLAGAPKLDARPKLAQARQVTDQVGKLLKTAGRKREAALLIELRDDFMARRDKAAWSALKARFGEWGLSEKAYRALKQGEADPLACLARLEALDPTERAGMGASRLVEALR